MLNTIPTSRVPVGLRYLILNRMYEQYPNKSLDFYDRKLNRAQLPFNKSEAIEGYMWWEDIEGDLLRHSSEMIYYYKYYPYSLKKNTTHKGVVYVIIDERLEKLTNKYFPIMAKKVGNKDNFIVIEPSNKDNNYFKKSVTPLPGTTQFRTATKIEVELFNRIKNNGGKR